MISAGTTYPYPAIDTAASRSDERLTAFLTEIASTEGLDQYFELYPTWDYFYSKKMVRPLGAQIRSPINTGASPNFKRIRGYDTFLSSGHDLGRPILYDTMMVSDAAVISFQELREIATDDLKAYDRVKGMRDRILSTCAENMSADLFASTQGDNNLTSLIVAVDSTGTAGNLSAATEAKWAAQESDHSSANYSVGGYKRMVNLFSDLRKNKAKTDLIVMTTDLADAYELGLDIDVRYTGDQGTMGRGASDLLFKRVKIIADGDCAANTMLFLDTSKFELRVDDAADMTMDPFIEPDLQKAQISKFLFRAQLCMWGRREQGKIIQIVA